MQASLPDRMKQERWGNCILFTQHGTGQGAVAKFLGEDEWQDEEGTRGSPGSAPEQKKTPSTQLEVRVSGQVLLLLFLLLPSPPTHAQLGPINLPRTCQ